MILYHTKKLRSPLASSFFFVGPMGAGKTTIGKIIAKKIDYFFYDSDVEIERNTGASIPLIFELEGERGFRQREKEMINSLTQQQNIILSTGGGAVLLRENREFLVRRGIVIYLMISVEEQYHRIKDDKNRPLIQQQNPLDLLHKLNKERAPLYNEIANYIVSCDQIGLDLLVESILNRIITNNDKHYPWILEKNENTKS